MVSLAEEDHLRRLFRVPSCHSYLQLMAELSTLGCFYPPPFLSSFLSFYPPFVLSITVIPS